MIADHAVNEPLEERRVRALEKIANELGEINRRAAAEKEAGPA